MQSSLKKYYIVLGIIVFLVFGNTLSNGYNMDDNLVTQHHRLTSKESDSSFLSIPVEVMNESEWISDRASARASVPRRVECPPRGGAGHRGAESSTSPSRGPCCD